MATISTEKMYLKNTGSFVKKVTYSNGYFRIKLPDIVCEELLIKDSREKELKGSSETEVNKLFKDRITEWENIQTEHTKVIIFEAKFQGALLREHQARAMNDGDEMYKPFYKTIGYGGDERSHYFCCDDIDAFNEASLGLLIQWGVYKKKTFKDKSDYKFISGRPFRSVTDRGTRLNSGLVEIEHTEEREAFFLELDESFARMIAKVYKALGDLTPEKLLALVSSGIKLLGN